MGIFSKFFKGKKIIEATVEKALEENETKNLPEMQDKALADEIDRAEQKAAESIRVIAKQYLPADVSSDYCQLEMVKTLINNIRVPESLYSETEKLLQKVKTGEITFIQCSGAVANRINNWMNDENCANLSQSLQDNNNDALLKTWVSIDYYISTLKRDFSKNLRKIRNELTEKIVLLGLDKADNQELSDIITLEKELNETAKDKEKVKTAEFAAKRKELAAHLISRKSLFVLFDEDFNSGFPYVSIDGRIEIFLRYETGVCLKKHYEKTNYGHTTLRRLEKKEYEKLFRAMIHMGIHLARLDNGIFPVDLLVSELAAGEGSCNVVERFNSAMRGLFIRNLQLKSRIQKASQQIKGTLQEKAMLEAMLTCRFNGYREFGNSIVYVFSNPPFEKGVTLYTKKALEKAKKLCKAAKLDEKALVAPGDSEYKVYEGGMNFRVTHKIDDDSMEHSLVCAFTSRMEAEKARLHFEKFGCNDSVVVVTFEELAGQIKECAGTLVDMSSYGLEIKKREFEQIHKCKSVRGKVAISLKKKDETPPKSEEDENTSQTDEENGSEEA